MALLRTLVPPTKATRKASTRKASKPSAKRAAEEKLAKTAPKAAGAKSKPQNKARATTFRLDPRLQAGLALIQGDVRLPLNTLVNDAVEMFVRARSAELESELGSRLEQIKAYRRSDPGFKLALKRVAAAEMDVLGRDPVEGHVATGSDDSVGPATEAVRKILSHRR
jgi:hypothetical protein